MCSQPHARRRGRRHPPLLQRAAGLVALVVVAVSLCSQLTTPAFASPPDGPPPVAGSIGLRLVDVPSEASADPRAQLYIVDHLAPGAKIVRRIEISNGTTKTTHVGLYPAAAEIVGGLFVGAMGDTPNELSAWTTVGPAVVDLATNARSIATVTIAVPSDASPGERYGVVWAEVRAGATDGTGITNVSRVGIRLYISVGPGGAPAADFAIESLTAQRSADGVPSITATVRNTGGRALDMSGDLQLEAGPGGLRAGPFPASLGTTLAIGTAEPVRIVLDKALPAGSWEATITLRSGTIERTAHAAIVVPDIGASAPVKATQSARVDRTALVEWCTGGALLAAAAIALVRRRRHPLHTPQPLRLVAPPTGPLHIVQPPRLVAPPIGPRHTSQPVRLVVPDGPVVHGVSGPRRIERGGPDRSSLPRVGHCE